MRRPQPRLEWGRIQSSGTARFKSLEDLLRGSFGRGERIDHPNFAESLAVLEILGEEDRTSARLSGRHDQRVPPGQRVGLLESPRSFHDGEVDRDRLPSCQSPHDLASFREAMHEVVPGIDPKSLASQMAQAELENVNWRRLICTGRDNRTGPDRPAPELFMMTAQKPMNSGIH